MARRRTPALGAFLAGGLVVTVLLALVVSGFASAEPDGLEKVAEDQGFMETARDHLFAEGPLADYGIQGVDNERLSTGLSGVIGVAVTFLVGAGLFAIFRRRTPAPAEDGRERDADASPPAGTSPPAGGDRR